LLTVDLKTEICEMRRDEALGGVGIEFGLQGYRSHAVRAPASQSVRRRARSVRDSVTRLLVSSYPACKVHEVHFCLERLMRVAREAGKGITSTTRMHRFG
jgi:hypothetical protein